MTQPRSKPAAARSPGDLFPTATKSPRRALRPAPICSQPQLPHSSKPWAAAGVRRPGGVLGALGLACALLAGCASTASPPAPSRDGLDAARPLVQGDASQQTPVLATVSRLDEEGAPLSLRISVYRAELGQPRVLVDERQSSAPVSMTLAPGRYSVFVFARPAPFAFDLLVDSDREPVHAFVYSAPRGHTVVTERRTRVEGGVVVDRKIQGFGWGPRPDPLQPRPTDPEADSEALFAETLARTRRALEAQQTRARGRRLPTPLGIRP